MQRNESIPDNIIAAIKAGNDDAINQYVEDNRKVKLNATDASGRNMIEHAIENNQFGMAARLMGYPEFDIKQSAKKLVSLCNEKIKDNNIQKDDAAPNERKPFLLKNQKLTDLIKKIDELMKPEIQEARNKQAEQNRADLVEAAGGAEKFKGQLDRVGAAAQTTAMYNKKMADIREKMLNEAENDPKAQIKFLQKMEKSSEAMKDPETKAIVAEFKNAAIQRMVKPAPSDPGTVSPKVKDDTRRTQTDPKAKSGTTKGMFAKFMSKKGKEISEIREKPAEPKNPTPITEKTSTTPTPSTAAPETSKEQKESYSTPGLGRRK